MVGARARDCDIRAALAPDRITRAWHPDEAEDRFLAEFHALWPTDERKAA